MPRKDFHNILALTGDYPTAGFRGLPEPVFDLDSVGLIALLRAMNEGLEVPGRGGKQETLPKTDFFIGAAVSPFKRHERELMPQYYKLLRKIRAGAQWVIPQLGYDMRKFHEIKLLLASRGMADFPVIGNVYLLTRGVAKLFNSGKLAGCVVSDELLEQCEKYAAGPDKGQAFFRELAAKQLAVFRGLGFAAGYLGGSAKLETFGQIIDLAESYAADDWQEFIKEIQFSQPDEFFLFEHDPQTGLGSPDRFNPQFIASLARPPKSKEVTLNYRLSRFVHRLAFTPRQGALRPDAAALSALGQEARHQRPGGLLAGKGVETRPVRMPGLRRLQPAGVRLSLPAVLLFQVRPQRPLRRLGRWTLRVGRQGVHLGADLRATEELRRIADDARRPAGVL